MSKKDIAIKDPYVIQLSKPYIFNTGEIAKEYKEIDLSGLEKLSTDALLQAERAWNMKGNASNQMETNYAYCLEVAALAMGQPVEFFSGLPMRDGIVVKSVVQKHFFGLME